MRRRSAASSAESIAPDTPWCRSTCTTCAGGSRSTSASRKGRNNTTSARRKKKRTGSASSSGCYARGNGRHHRLPCRHLRFSRRVRFPRELQPGVHNRVGIEGEALDAFLDQPPGEVEMVGGPLPADADVFSRLAARLDRQSQHGFHRRIALVERVGYESRVAFEGTSHIMMSRRPFSPRFKPFAASSSITWAHSFRVRTNGTMISTLVRPISFLTRRIASHSISKQRRNDSAT